MNRKECLWTCLACLLMILGRQHFHAEIDALLFTIAHAILNLFAILVATAIFTLPVIFDRDRDRDTKPYLPSTPRLNIPMPRCNPPPVGKLKRPPLRTSTEPLQNKI